MKTSLLLLTVLALSLGAAQARATPPVAVELGATADAAIAAGLPGVSIYARRGSETTVVVRGHDDVARRSAMTATDSFRVGSVTKMFVATVVMQLVHERKLSLADTVEQHLPGLVRNGGDITYAELLSHTSGLPDYFSNNRIYGPYEKGNLTYRWSHAAIARISSADKPVFAPGARGRFAYSNTGYYILGLTVEKVTGHSLEDELDRRVIRPLGLTHTSLPTSTVPAGRYAHGYTTPGKQELTAISPSILWAAGGLVSTPTDVATFVRALQSGRLLPKALVRRMLTPQVTLPGPPSHRQQIGLGVFLSTLPCGVATWGHGGDLPGYTTQAYTSVDGTRQVVVAVNAGEESGFSPAASAALGRIVSLALCG
jgi:D-alanyl-D-alanine carboxypeptidase